MESNLLCQIVDKPTHCDSTSGTENILDIVITNNGDLFRDVDVLPTRMSDHDSISIILSHHFNHASVKEQGKLQKDTPVGFNSLNFHKADYDGINADLCKINWDSLKAESSDEDFSITFYQVLLSVCEKHTPKKVFSNKHKSKYQKLCYKINRKRRKIKGRIKALQCLQPQSGTISTLKRRLVELEKEAQEKIHEYLHHEEQKVLQTMQSNPKVFYSYAKKRNVSQSKIGPLRNSENGEDVFCDDPKGMADILQKQFISVFSEPSNVVLSDAGGNSDCSATLEDFNFTVDNLIKAIDEIKMNSSCGNEGCPAMLFKKCKVNLVYPLLLLWRESLDTGQINNMFLHQLITPLYKGKGSKCEAVNYRPISLTSHIIKIFERVVRDKIVNFLEENCLLSDGQHGFRKGRSCLSELLAHYEEILQNANNGKGTDTVYLDFAKAFDKVDHQLLLMKFESIGIKGKLLGWLKSFLSNRTQEVAVDGFKSFVSAVISGVPQGSVLGPILFLIFINDISSSIDHCKLKSFADDTKLSQSISCQNDADQLQSDLDKVMEWSTLNNMALNEEKFEFIKNCYEFDSTSLELPFGYYNSCYKTTNSTLIDCSFNVKDLGVAFSSNSTFDVNIANIVKKAKSKAAWILSVFKTRNRDEMMELYKTYVRSHLEYCCPLWNPYLVRILPLQLSC